MNSTYRSPGWLFGLAFLLAAALRFMMLGALPLTDDEAVHALSALDIVRGTGTSVGAQPLYVVLTAPLFYIFGSYNFVARFLPALAGSLLVLVPYLFEQRLKKAAIFISFLLAVDPGLVALSRQAAGGVIAIACFLFAWVFLEQRRYKPAGVFAALAILSGPSIWAGLLGFGISLALMQFVSPKPVEMEQAEGARDAAAVPFMWQPLTRNTLIALFAVGTLLGLVPRGLSGIFQSMAEYGNSWTLISDVTGARLMLVLFAYQPFTFLLALIALIRGWIFGKRRIMRLSIWMLVSLLLVVFSPGRQITDLVWMLIPMLTLAGMELARHIHVFEEERKEIAGVMGLVLFILAFVWLAFSSLMWVVIPSEPATLRLWLFGGALIMLLLSVILIALGWSWRVAKLGTLYALVVFFGIYNFSAVAGVAGLRPEPSPEFWPSSPRPAQAELLLQTVNDISEWGKGNDFSLPVTIVGVKSPALQWLLRERTVTYMDSLDPASSPELIITLQENDPALAAAYRGQDFIWNQYPKWNTVYYGDWIKWLVMRRMPKADTAIILWARTDVFIDRPSQP